VTAAIAALGHPVRFPLWIEDVGWVVFCDCHHGDVVGFDRHRPPWLGTPHARHPEVVR
jgi:hypothetical protein